jgi:hypothetical protein
MKHLYLFGHGMMLFWYRRRTSESIDGYRILIPQCPMHMGCPQHELRLGTSPGAPTSYLGYAADPQPTKFYQLQFGAKTSVKPRGAKDCNVNLGLYERYGVCKAEPNYGYDAPDGVAFAIDIPYPSKDKQLRKQSYKGPVFLPGDTRETFQIYPCEIPRSNLFTYEIANPDVPVVLQNMLEPTDCQVLGTFSHHHAIKLYLYSGPPHVIADEMHPPMGHSHALNDMLRYGNRKRLDLTPNPHSGFKCTPLLPGDIPHGFQIEDYLHLAELNDHQDYCSSPIHGANPAECSQGGGC